MISSWISKGMLSDIIDFWDFVTKEDETSNGAVKGSAEIKKQ